MHMLELPGFIVRPLRLEDADAWARYALLPEVKEFTSSTATTVDDIRAIIHRVLTAEASSPVHFAIVPDGSESMVASVGFHTISPLNGTAEITYDVAPSYWNRGIAKAACRAASSWGFKAKGWHRIQATTVLQHARSQRVLERCGYKREGIVRNFRLVRDLPTDYWLYSVLPGEVASAA
jgi:[ribosomal protein S5]-alanine N-acetyltransferase